MNLRRLTKDYKLNELQPLNSGRNRAINCVAGHRRGTNADQMLIEDKGCYIEESSTRTHCCVHSPDTDRYGKKVQNHHGNCHTKGGRTVNHDRRRNIVVHDSDGDEGSEYYIERRPTQQHHCKHHYCSRKSENRTREPSEDLSAARDLIKQRAERRKSLEGNHDQYDDSDIDTKRNSKKYHSPRPRKLQSSKHRGTNEQCHNCDEFAKRYSQSKKYSPEPYNDRGGTQERNSRETPRNEGYEHRSSMTSYTREYSPECSNTCGCPFTRGRGESQVDGRRTISDSSCHLCRNTDVGNSCRHAFREDCTKKPISDFQTNDNGKRNRTPTGANKDEERYHPSEQPSMRTLTLGNHHPLESSSARKYSRRKDIASDDDVEQDEYYTEERSMERSSVHHQSSGERITDSEDTSNDSEGVMVCHEDVECTSRSFETVIEKYEDVEEKWSVPYDNKNFLKSLINNPVGLHRRIKVKPKKWDVPSDNKNFIKSQINQPLGLHRQNKPKQRKTFIEYGKERTTKRREHIGRSPKEHKSKKYSRVDSSAKKEHFQRPSKVEKQRVDPYETIEEEWSSYSEIFDDGEGIAEIKKDVKSRKSTKSIPVSPNHQRKCSNGYRQRDSYDQRQTDGQQRGSYDQNSSHCHHKKPPSLALKSEEVNYTEERTTCGKKIDQGKRLKSLNGERKSNGFYL